MRQFTLTQEQYNKLDEWKSAIKTIYGEYGFYTYSFTEDGIGMSVKISNSLCSAILDLTDYDNF